MKPAAAAHLAHIVEAVKAVDRMSKRDQRTDLDAVWATLYGIRTRAERALAGSELTTNAARVSGALAALVAARELLRAAGARRTLERVRLAISSAKGARRHAHHEPYREERRIRRGRLRHSADL